MLPLTFHSCRYAAGAKISINQENAGERTTVIGIFAPNRASLDAAVKSVENANTVLERGATHKAKVVEVLPFGWVCQLEPGGERGLLHVTEYSHGPERIESADYLPLGEELEVKVRGRGVGVGRGGGDNKTSHSRRSLVHSYTLCMPYL